MLAKQRCSGDRRHHGHGSPVSPNVQLRSGDDIASLPYGRSLENFDNFNDFNYHGKHRSSSPDSDGSYGSDSSSSSSSLVQYNDSFTTPITVTDAEGLHSFTLSLEMLGKELRRALYGMEEMLQFH
ncbi:hypothetical protein AGDE_12619 [Angomonas deanei]|nr:hypothetical protein AGDE_12619 [Angomonas deanei]|eukprot:EPY23945.1 hypothetical protein AGDE_12619 [Angomonas deanei]